MQPFLDAVRKASLPAIWSQGVKLAREGSVLATSGEPAAARGAPPTFRVRAPGHAIAPTVTLFVDDLEWSCDCGGKVDPCAHVAASAIAAAAAENEGEALSVATAPVMARARLEYRFATKGRVLTLARHLIFSDGRQERLGALSSQMATARVPAGFTPTHADLLIDRILGAPARENVPLARLSDLFAAMAEAEVTHNGTKVSVSGERVMPRAVVADAPGGGFVLRMERDPGVTEVVAMGVVRCGNVLRPLGRTDTTGDFLERLPLSRTFAKAQETELVTLVLPKLENELAVDIRTVRLPRKKIGARPRIAMDLSHQGHTLSVLPTLVYGDPPIARVDGDDIVLLGSDVPVRAQDAERRLLQNLRDELNLVPGRRVDLDGSEAVRFAARLRKWQTNTGDERQAAVFEGKALSVRLDSSVRY